MRCPGPFACTRSAHIAFRRLPVAARVLRMMSLAEFRDRTVFGRPMRILAMVLGAMGLILLLLNLVTTARTVAQEPSLTFGEVFASTDAVLVSDRPALVAMVWGPVVLVPIALLVGGIDMGGHGSRVERAYRRYLAGGWVTEQWPTSLQVKGFVGSHTLVAVPMPTWPPGTLASPLRMLAERERSMSWAARRRFRQRLQRGAVRGFRNGGRLAELPEATLLCTERIGGQQVVVCPVRRGRARIYALRGAPVPVMPPSGAPAFWA